MHLIDLVIDRQRFLRFFGPKETVGVIGFSNNLLVLLRVFLPATNSLFVDSALLLPDVIYDFRSIVVDACDPCGLRDGQTLLVNEVDKMHSFLILDKSVLFRH